MEYMDIEVNSADHESVSGRFVIVGADGLIVAYDYTYWGKLQQLETHAPFHIASAFGAAVSEDAHEAWMYHRDLLRELN